MTAADFTWDEAANAYTSGDIELTGECWLRVVLSGKGRVAIRKANSADGPWPVVLMSTWTGPDFEIRIFGETLGKHIKIETTSAPSEASLDNI